MQPDTIDESVTSWLVRWGEGDDAAIERVTEMVYRDLKRLAAHYLRGEQSGHTLQPTALVHEAYLHVASIREMDWKARGQFIAVVSKMMRRILIDHARSRRSMKRDPCQVVDWPEARLGEEQTLDVLLIDDALTKMSASYPRHAEIVQLRFFGGLESKEVAEVLQVSLRTVERDWRFARAWLQHRIAS